MEKREIINLILFLLGLFLIINSQINITGAVIGVSDLALRLSSIIGLALMLIAVTLFIAKRARLEEIVTMEEFGKRIRDSSPDVVVFDTSAILDYSAVDIEAELKKYPRVIVPESARNEIRDPRLREIVKRNSKTIHGWESYKELARSFLEKTEKPQLYKELMPYFTGEKKITKYSEQVRIGKLTRRVRRLMLEKKGISLEVAESEPKYALGEVKKYLEQHCKISETDVEVLANAIYTAASGERTCVGEMDIDFRQAINLIKKERPDIGQNLFYEEPWKKKRAA